ncbi:coproporphyrinogen III oxidase [Mycolicibacterium moriokaense]|uniref:Heme chaperone HemW n=1 Tax=Mycolicibacterium moriokaense TaxID=39691 RepID=A0AAD1HBY4_9MYCO|nr:radical SAM family heme chaperone HemW [Mycolicibacterium moriokaense]MCV7039744.1 coproporphyrinogen III oxidase [Mycolicibacterium moriokaense]ORB25606.1 coproporphyrinogen III oxidase [Mycolicibacterium moriokaense]BBX01809.1 coproporphyrinogen III oxidase [Mycolicibacterium moriokaense]
MTVRTAGTRELPDLALTPGRAFGIYIHVPFCVTRCGYCDFNTYTPSELGGANPDSWLAALRAELALAADRLGSARPEVDTVFVGGGTPSMLGGQGLASVLDAVRSHFTLAADAEVTTEANPESTSPQLFEQLCTAGFTRVSLGMQSVAPHVLAVLDRVHSPGRALDAARDARAAGFDHVNLDLIYGTPGETDDDLRRSVDAAIEAQVDHVSAYALVVEDGTALARRVRRGEISAPDNDVLAHRYELIDARLCAAGLGWYEVSNWCLPGGECRHNIGYWNGGEWWGAGPGAHGYVGATRWWNVKHPNAYAHALAEGVLPVADFEQLDSGAQHTEDVMLRVRLRDGLPLAALNDAERRRAQTVIEDGLLTRDGDRLILTDPGRLLADAVVRTLLD